VLYSEQLDDAVNVFGCRDPAADPAGLRQHMVRLGATGCNHFVVKLAWQREVGKAVAVHVAHFLSSVSIFGAAEPAR
jgi:hypothetical protein